MTGMSRTSLSSVYCCQVTAAVTKQLETLNTNARYLHDKLVVLAEGITQKMPEPLQVCFPTAKHILYVHGTKALCLLPHPPQH